MQSTKQAKNLMWLSDIRKQKRHSGLIGIAIGAGMIYACWHVLQLFR